MDTAREQKLTRVKPRRKLAVTLAVSAPVIFWILSLFSGFVIGKERTDV